MSYQANGVVPDIESIEANSPVVVLRHELIPDTGGPGAHRGGAAMLRDSLWQVAAAHTFNELRYKRTPGFGVCGGRGGAMGGIWHFPAGDANGAGELHRPGLADADYRSAIAAAGVVDKETNLPAADGQYVYPFGQSAYATEPMAVVRYRTNGGGGWGDPLARDPERVKIDVRDGYVTVDGALRDYGVVIVGDPDTDPEGLAVDVAATQHARQSRT
jgi:N-methylhydantoinase B